MLCVPGVVYEDMNMQGGLLIGSLVNLVKFQDGVFKAVIAGALGLHCLDMLYMGAWDVLFNLLLITVTQV